MSFSCLTVIILALLNDTEASMFSDEPQFSIEAEKNRAFNKSYLLETLKIKPGNMAECLEHCMQNCACQSFQICRNTECQLCKTNKFETVALLHEKLACTYAVYKVRRLEEDFKKIEYQCSSMGCPIKYNCCSEQTDLCPKNKICKPTNSLEKPWKRFACECPSGYHGDHCDLRIPTSCKGYVNGSRKSGKYDVQSFDGTIYEIYCHFDSYGAWTLVQSYSLANGSHNSKFSAFQQSLNEDLPVSENELTWSGYRLSREKMEAIKDDFVLFTCNYEKHGSMNESDHLQISIEKLGPDFDILLLSNYAPSTFPHSAKIGGKQLNDCPILLHQDRNLGPHVHVEYEHKNCQFVPFPSESTCSSYLNFDYFGPIRTSCFDTKHRCHSNENSSTQVWFGHEG